jgi:fumarate hydratase class II
LVNAAAGRLPQWMADSIVRAADEAIEGKLDKHFPLLLFDLFGSVASLWRVCSAQTPAAVA